MQVFTFIIPIFLFLLLLLIKIFLPDLYMSIIMEDSYIESAQALFYFVAACVAFILTIRFRKKNLRWHSYLYFLFTIGFFLITMEEISWGQRIFSIQTPDYLMNHNLQYEISLHNLDRVKPLIHKGYIILSGLGAFAWILFRSIKSLDNKPLHILNFIIPDWMVSSYFFFTFVVYFMLEIICPFATKCGMEGLRIGNFLIWKDQEPAELFLALGCMAFIISKLVQLNNNQIPAKEILE